MFSGFAFDPSFFFEVLWISLAFARQCLFLESEVLGRSYTREITFQIRPSSPTLPKFYKQGICTFKHEPDNIFQPNRPAQCSDRWLRGLEARIKKKILDRCSLHRATSGNDQSDLQSSQKLARQSYILSRDRQAEASPQHAPQPARAVF